MLECQSISPGSFSPSGLAEPGARVSSGQSTGMLMTPQNHFVFLSEKIAVLVTYRFSSRVFISLLLLVKIVARSVRPPEHAFLHRSKILLAWATPDPSVGGPHLVQPPHAKGCHCTRESCCAGGKSATTIFRAFTSWNDRRCY